MRLPVLAGAGVADRPPPPPPAPSPNGPPAAEGRFRPDPGRTAAGWQYRFVTHTERAREMADLYRQLGFEVALERVAGEHEHGAAGAEVRAPPADERRPAADERGAGSGEAPADGCAGCFESGGAHALYTRRRATPAPAGRSGG
ncbi:MAG: hypothetical protein RQ751_04215 [Longimicrobiales bacterium]|nr:hypothetical protein [Longimicrobiales bacterium]